MTNYNEKNDNLELSTQSSNEINDENQFIQEYKPTIKDKINLFLYKINPINILQDWHTQSLIKERNKIIEKYQADNFLSDEDYSKMYKENYFHNISNKANQIDTAFKNKNVLSIKDMFYNGDISYSDAYLSFYHSYNKMYSNWVMKKRKEENKKLDENTKIVATRKEHNKNIGNSITYSDYQDLFNIIQSSYLLMLVNFKQLSIKCKLDTMLLLQIVDKKLMDYTMPSLIKVTETMPEVEVLLEFVPFSDNSSIVRITGVSNDSNNTNDNDKDKNNNPVFQLFRKCLIDNQNNFKDFLNNNYKLISLINQEYEMAENPNFENIENSYAKTHKENLAIATFTYINNYNILLEELKRGVIVGVQDMRMILESIIEIETVAVQKKNETSFKATDRILNDIKNTKDNNENQDETIDNSHSEKNNKSSYTIKIGENKRNYELINNIKTSEELLKLIRKQHLYAKIPKTQSKNTMKNSSKNTQTYVSKKQKEKEAMKNRLKINIANEDKIIEKQND